MPSQPQRPEEVFDLGDDDIVPPRKSNPWKFILLGCGFFALLIMAAAGVVVFRIVNAAKEFIAQVERDLEASDGANLFREANRSMQPGQSALGNSEAAIKLAQEFSLQLKQPRDEVLSKHKKPANFNLADNTLVYCQLVEERCAFLLHAPDLEKFDNDTKDYLGDLAWVAAHNAISASDIQIKPTDIAVGLRGETLYDRVVHGDLGAAGAAVLDSISFTDEGDTAKTGLYSYFEPAITLDGTPATNDQPAALDSSKTDTPKDDATTSPEASTEKPESPASTDDAPATKSKEDAKSE